MEVDDLPYVAEYAKSNRSMCRGCKKSIEQGTLRIAVLVQSRRHDGKDSLWFHHKCFFGKQRPKSVDDIAKFQTLRIEDQEYIKKHIDTAAAVIVPAAKGKKRNAAAAMKGALQDFKIEHAKSARSTCHGCEQKILKDEVRISKKDFTTEVGMKYGGQDMWHHVSCFAQLRAELGYFEGADKLPGFKTLTKDAQSQAKSELPPIKQENVPTKKAKTEDSVDAGGIDKQELKKQNKIFYDYRDQLQKLLKKPDIWALLRHNKQAQPPGVDDSLDRLADIMTFGALKPCDVCKQGQLVFDGHKYVCEGDLTEWTKCKAVCTEPPKRTAFKVPSSFKNEKYPVLENYKFVSRTRVVKPVQQPQPSTSNGVKKEEEPLEPKIKRALPALYEMEFVILGKSNSEKDQLKKQIISLGGKVTTKISSSVMAVIAAPKDVENMGSRMQAVKDADIHVVPQDFLDEAKDHVGKIPELVVEKCICDWGSDPSKRLPPEPSKSAIARFKSGKSIYTKSVPSKVKMTIKGGMAVDPDSGLENRAHVYKSGTEVYSIVLGRTDITEKKNSYYKMQLLESDSGNSYWLFRSWGRIGTTIGDTKEEQFSDLHDAKQEFRRLYKEKSGNFFENHRNFVKVPGLMYPIDVDYGPGDDVKLDITDTPSDLPVAVQNLIRLIFDVNSMKKVMMEFELDTEKMPLGKLSKSQMQQAFKVLSELQTLVNQTDTQYNRFVDASNRFYTLVPHSFGIDEPPVIRDAETIKQKLDMLDNLMELEIAYNLMRGSSGHTVDNYYKQLNAEIGVLDKDSEEFGFIKEYVKNTHAETHSSYELEIEDIYTVKRQGEDKRYKPFRKLHNRKLLWHGSRTTNYAGILSQGLRIAPPEAPVTGYMFGKGIYFADMVSKSANYCCTNPSNPKGLLLLCEVALGDMYERLKADYIEKLPKGKHSTKGVGRTQPDPKASKIINDVEIPLGKAVTSNDVGCSLLYNEYIVYDVAQVNVKYLLKTNFKYKY